MEEQWGRDVIRCAWCHGWEVRGTRTGVLGTSPAGVHRALVLRQLGDRVTLLTHTAPDLGEAREQLAAVGVQVEDGPVRRLRSDQGDLQAVVLDDGREVPVDTPRHLAPGMCSPAASGEVSGPTCAARAAPRTSATRAAATPSSSSSPWRSEPASH